jgi:hypothetical protein
LRREIFALAVSTCSALDGLAGSEWRCGFTSLPASGISGWVGCIEPRCGGCVRIGPAEDDPDFAMLINALGRNWFE